MTRSVTYTPIEAARILDRSDRQIRRIANMHGLGTRRREKTREFITLSGRDLAKIRSVLRDFRKS